MRVPHLAIALCLICAALLSAHSLRPATNEADDTWTGILVDSNCPTKPQAMCEVTDSTKLFGIVASNGTYAAFDREGNHQAKAAIGSRQNRTGAIGAFVKGRIESQILKVDFLRVL